MWLAISVLTYECVCEFHLRWCKSTLIFLCFGGLRARENHYSDDYQTIHTVFHFCKEKNQKIYADLIDKSAKKN
jgi:hypothetical protein